MAIPVNFCLRVTVNLNITPAVVKFCRRLVNTEGRLRDADRKTEALATLQSHRWMEFSKMADSMKDLSQNMLSQSKSNTRKAAIRADLDEELDL